MGFRWSGVQIPPARPNCLVPSRPQKAVPEHRMIISDAEAIRLVLPQREVAASERHPRFACYLGAGVSVEADVKTASEISNEIRTEMAEGLTPDAVKRLEKDLQWDDSTLRYVTCIKRRYPDIALRVDYFRYLVKGLTPSFAHHAVALLM